MGRLIETTENTQLIEFKDEEIDLLIELIVVALSDTRVLNKVSGDKKMVNSISDFLTLCIEERGEHG